MLISLVAGVSLCFNYPELWLGGVLFAIALIFLVFRHTVFSALAFIAFIGWGLLYLSLPDRHIFDNLPEGTRLYGVVRSSSQLPSGQSADVEIEKIIFPDSSVREIPLEKVRLYAANMPQTLMVGQIVSFPCDRQHGKQRIDLPDEIDYESVMRRAGIYHSFRIYDESVSIAGEDSSPRFRLERYRERIINYIFDCGFSQELTSFLIAVITGDRTYMPETHSELFSAAGVAHVLALSGAHVAVIALIISIGLFPMTFFYAHRLRIFIVILSIWIYAIVTGLSPSVVRATIMLTLVGTSFLIGKRHSAMNSLFAAAILIIIFSPFSLFHPGFQLSFVAVAALLLLSSRLNPFERRHKTLYFLAEIIIVPFVSLLATAPLSAYYFHFIPTYFFITAFPVSLILTILLFGGVLSLMLTVAGFSFSPGISLMDWMYDKMMGVIEFTVSLPGATIRNIYPDEYVVVLLLTIPVFLTGWIVYRRRFWLISVIMVSVASLTGIFFIKPVYPSKEIFITRESRHTNMLLHIDNSLQVITTSPPTGRDGIIEECRRRYADFIGKREIGSVTVINDSLMNRRPGVIRVKVCDLQLCILSAGNFSPIAGSSPDYLIVCKGFRDDIIDAVTSIRPKRVVLSYDMHPKRSERYCSELDSLSIPFHNIRSDGPMHIVLE